MGKKLVLDSFKEKANIVHNNKYDYSKSELIDSRTKLCVICPEHGEFWIIPSKHLYGQGCKQCGRLNTIKSLSFSKENFIEKCRELYGDRFILDEVEYINSKTKVKIICRKHGEFMITPNNFLRGHCCPKCKSEKIAYIKHYTKTDFIENSEKVHGDEYDYTDVDYINSQIKVTIKHKKCGYVFQQLPKEHIFGYGCPKCGGKLKLSLFDFIKKAREIHGDKYDYSKVEYVNNRTKVCIICPEHGEFWQTPRDHLSNRGCPKCKQSKLEKEIGEFLSKQNVFVETQKKFEWLGKQSLDFYLPDYNIAIECQGEQHFKPINFFGGKNCFEQIKQRDINKYNLCKDNGIVLLFYTNCDFDTKNNNFEIYNEQNIINDKASLLEYIKEG